LTLRLYYEDSYLTRFSANVIELFQSNAQAAVVLDQTAFYPTSGGQPYDTGVLGTSRVIKVEEDDSGRVTHILDSPLPLGPTTGLIDWSRRFDHMQQHTGQHILSQAFVQVARLPTISFHLGTETSTIDLEQPVASNSLIQEAEELASRIVFEDRPVHTLTVGAGDLAALGVRKESQRTGDIRVIDVEGFDRSPCGGTHVRRSGEIGLISILGHERYKGGTRVEFACGGRALRILRTDHGILKALGNLYSGKLEDLHHLATKVLEERSQLGRENSRLREELLDFEARELLLSARKIAGLLIVRKNFTTRDLETLKILAQRLAARGGVLAVLALINDTGQVVVARSRDVAGDCGDAVKKTAARLGGRGGGRPELAQAGGLRAEGVEDWLQSVEDYFTHPAGKETSH
jgi:alanyl-tRNA synthetase